MIALLLRCNNRPDDPALFALHVTCAAPYSDRPLKGEEPPLRVQQGCTGAERGRWTFVLRRSVTQGVVERRVSAEAECDIEGGGETGEC